MVCIGRSESIYRYRDETPCTLLVRSCRWSWCTLQRVEMEKCQRSPGDIKKYGALTEGQMERRAKFRGLLALVSTTSDSKKRLEFVNRELNAAINVGSCAVMEKRPPALTREDCMGQPLKVELFEKKMKPVVAWRPREAGSRLHLSWRRFVQGAFAATTTHRWRQRFSFERRYRTSL